MSNQRPKRPGLIRNDFSAHNAADLKLSPHKSSEPFGFELVPSSTASAPNGAAAVGNQNKRWFSAAVPGNGAISDDASDAASDASSCAPIYVYHDPEEYAGYLDESIASSAAASAAAKKRNADFFAALGLGRPDFSDCKVVGTINPSSPYGVTSMEATLAMYTRLIKGKGRAIDSPISHVNTGDSDGKEPNEAFKALEAAGAAIPQFGYCDSSYMTSGVNRNTCKTTIAGPSGTNGRKKDNDDNYNED